MKNYDICIIGAGAAGLSAAIYAARGGRKTCVLEKLVAGGQVNSTPDIANYPGFNSISGWELSAKFHEQATACGAEFLELTAVKLTQTDNGAIVECDGGEVIACRAAIIATGAAVKTLGLEGEKELTGSGVSYCATCDGAFFRGKRVMVAGGGKAAEIDVKYLEKIAEKVYWVYGGDLQTAVGGNVEKLEHTAVTALIGNPLKAVRLSSGVEIEVDGLFVAVGYSPASLIARGVVELDSKGYIITDENMATSAPNIFAAGDVRKKELRQIVTAAADGATAAYVADKLLRRSERSSLKK